MDEQINGVRLHFTDTGTYTAAHAFPNVPTFVFLHYFGGSSLSWQPLIDRLSPRYRCIALDMRGFGDSEAPATGYAVADYADDVAALIEHFHLTDFTLVGHSMGGKVAMAYAARQPAGLRELILIAPSPLSPEPISDDERQYAVEAYGQRAAAEQTLRTITARPLPAELQARVMDDNLRSSQAAWRAWLEHGSREDLSTLLPQISVPVLILSGEADKTIKPDVIQREVAARLSSTWRVQMIMLPDAAHLLPLESPDAVADAIRHFVNPQPNRYPAGSVRALLTTDLVTPQTRRALTERLENTERLESPATSSLPVAPQLFTPAEFDTLRAICARLLPNAQDLHIDLAAQLDARLQTGKGNGWRYDVLPPDQEAHQRGLQAVDETAQALYKQSFAALDIWQQDAVLRTVQSGAPPGATWKTLPAKRYFEELLAELAECYYSDPTAQETIGYVGMADAAGWSAIGLNQLEAWEPRHNIETIPNISAASLPTRQIASDQAAPPMRHYTLDEVVDAVVIGTGAGGAPLMARLAAAGMRVVALEAGKFWKPQSEFATDERAQSALYWNDERLSAGTDATAFGNNNSGVGVGGSTLHYTAYTPRAHADDLRLHSEFGVGVDWPLSYADLKPYYDELERYLGVSGPAAYPWNDDAARPSYPLAPLPLNGAAQLMQRGCEPLGIRTSPAPNAALSARYYQPGVGWREACTNRGFCQAGCSVGAKASMDVTFIPNAIQDGAEVRAECFVTQFVRDSSGQITHVVYIKEGVEYRQACRTVFLCAGAVETPRLLLINGLANSSGQVGKNFMAHVGLQIWGQFHEDVRPYKGIPGGLISEDTHRPKGVDFAGGYLLQSIGVMPVTYASQLVRGRLLWGEPLQDHMLGYNHTAGINILGECLPYPGNYLELSNEHDARGLPKPRIHFSYGENERRLESHADLLMRAIWSNAGAREVWAFHRSAHIIGTCRMGSHSADAVVNPDGRSFDIPNLYIADNSIFPSALSVNPALTIMALSLRTADRFIEHAKQGNM